MRSSILDMVPHFATLFVALLTSEAAAVAQRPDLDSGFDAITQVYDHNDTTEDIESWLIHEDGSKVLRWRYSLLSSTGTGFNTLTTTLPFDRAGGIERLTDSAFLVAGWDSASQQGFLAHVILQRTSPQQMWLVSSTAYSFLDPHCIRWNRQTNTLFVWDYSSALYAVPLYPLLEPSASSFSLPLTSTSCPAVSQFFIYDALEAYGPDAGLDFAPVSPAHNHGTNEYPCYNARYDRSGNTWSVVPWTAIDRSAATLQGAYRVLNAWYVPTVGPLRVKGPSGAYEIVDYETSTVVYQGTLQSPPQWWGSDDGDLGTWESIAFSNGELLPGRSYIIRNVADPTIGSRTFLPLVRYGLGQRTEHSGVQWSMMRGIANGWEATVGNQSFGVSGQLLAHPSGGGVPVDFFLCLQAVPAGIPDPVLDTGGGAFTIVNPTVIGPRHLPEMLRSSIRWPLAHDVPIPNDIGLVGAKLFFQQLSVIDANVLTSDVFGVTIGI